MFFRAPVLPATLLLVSIGLCSVLHPVETAAVQAPPRLPLRINCGGGTIKDPQTGHVWQSDKPYVVRGKKYRFKQDLDRRHAEGLSPEPVLQSLRRANLVYRVPSLPNGTYVLRLHFVDGKRQAVRSMDFWVEGLHLIQNFSPRESAGGVDRGYVHELVVEVKDGNGLDLRGTRGHGDDVFLSAIEVLAAPKGSVATTPVVTSQVAPADLAQQLRRFADGPARVVWTRTEDEEDFYMKGPSGVLFGFDSEDGKGERLILGQQRSYASPMLTPDGSKVVFTDQVAHRCYVVNFDGTGLRELSPGYASDVWTDPETNITWVYVRTGWRNTKAPVHRFRLDDPSKTEVVWDKSGTGQPQTAWFHVSGDGKMAADAFPWPQCGLADLSGSGFKVLGKGCWPAVAPDSSHKAFYFVGQHTGIQFFDEPEATPRSVNLATVPGWTGRKVYHPRWTNDVRYLSVTAPQWMPETELYLGRFDASYTKIESWFRLTYNHSADFFGDAWFAAASKHNVPASAPATAKPVIATRPEASLPGTVFVWENERSRNAVTDAEGKVVRTWAARYEGQSRPNRWYGAHLKEGALHPDEDAAGHFSQSVASTSAFTLLLDLAPDQATATNGGVIMSLAASRNGDYITLRQEKARLVAEVREASGRRAQVSLGEVQPGRLVQVGLSFSQGRLTGYQNGAETASTPANPAFIGWKPVDLIFGNDTKSAQPWTGMMENIRLLDRALSGEERMTLAAQSASTWQSRQPVAKVVVEAELLQASEPDDPATIAPYVRSLGENVYRVTKVIEGTLSDTELIVLQWVVLGGNTLANSQREEGKIYRLELEPADAHPELAGEHRSTDIFEPVLNVYYDVGL